MKVGDRVEVSQPHIRRRAAVVHGCAGWFVLQFDDWEGGRITVHEHYQDVRVLDPVEVLGELGRAP